MFSFKNDQNNSREPPMIEENSTTTETEEWKIVFFSPCIVEFTDTSRVKVIQTHCMCVHVCLARDSYPPPLYNNPAAVVNPQWAPFIDIKSGPSVW